MEEQLDTQQAPPEGQAPAGQAEPVQEPQKGSPDVETRLTQIERDYKELQKDYTRKAQQLAELRRASQGSQGTPTQTASDTDFDWGNPAKSLRDVVRGELTEFQKQQAVERATQNLIEETAEQHGIPKKQLFQYYQKLQEAATDPYELMETVARMYRADHADTAIAEATKAAQQTVERNARGVTTQSGAPQPTPQTKRVEDMTVEEHRQHIIQQYGVAPPEY